MRTGNLQAFTPTTFRHVTPHEDVPTDGGHSFSPAADGFGDEADRMTEDALRRFDGSARSGDGSVAHRRFDDCVRHMSLLAGEAAKAAWTVRRSEERPEDARRDILFGLDGILGRLADLWDAAEARLAASIDEAWEALEQLAVLSGVTGIVAAVVKTRTLVKSCRCEADADDGRMAELEQRLEDELRYLQELIDRLMREMAACAADDGEGEVDRTMGWLDSIVTPLERRVAEIRAKVSGGEF